MQVSDTTDLECKEDVCQEIIFRLFGVITQIWCFSV